MKIIGRLGGFIVLFILLAWIVLLLGYYGKVELQKWKAERNTARFFKAVQYQRYDEAVRLFGEPLDQASLYELQPFRLVKYAGIKADFDDGCVCGGHAELTFQADGPPITAPAVFVLREGYKPGQVCALTSREERTVMPQLGSFNLVVCGSDSF